jgi:caspase domain-containing protein
MTTRNPLPAIAAALFLLFLVGLLLIATASVAAAAPAPKSGAPTSEVRLRRFVLLAGVDDGGPTRTRLRYATSDARALGRVLQSMGGVSPEDVVFVSTPTRAAFDAAFGDIEQRLRAGAAAGVRRELLVYYSGHSDEDGLLIGRDRFGYDELRARVQRAPADLRVVILDSCASGAFTRRKGGVKRPPFLLDASSDMRGHAFLTSSAADERAQESDRIAASYFTYYLVSGLRGAADVNQDRRVTLQEAYQFASQETLARTERSQAGPQHAAYEFDLAGTGDMVVTDVRGTQSGLVLTPELGGRITVREASGALVAELRKPAGNTIELGLDPGAYVVAMDSGTTVFQAEVALVAGKHTPLAAASFHTAPPREATVARGDDAPPEAGEPAATATATATPAAAAPLSEPTAFKAILFPFPGGADGRAQVNGMSFGFVADRAARVRGLQLAIGWAQADEELRGLQLSAGANLVRGEFRGMQLTAGLNILRVGAGRGLQLVGGANFVDGGFTGTQIAGGANVVTGKMDGFQLAGGVNVADEGRGWQLAGGINVARTYTGWQLATVNYAETVTGTQLGVVNVARFSANGFRLGVVNAARDSHGFSFGVVNVAKHDDGESFALINVVGNGIHDVSLFATDVMLTNVGFKLGGRHLYTNLIAGYQPGNDLPANRTSDQFTADTKRFATGAGIGWRVPIERGPLAFGEIEADWLEVRPVWSWTSNAPGMASLRLQAGLRLAPYVVLLAGAGVNVAVAPDSKDLDLSRGGPQSVLHSGDTTVRIYPGLIVGLQI